MTRNNLLTILFFSLLAPLAVAAPTLSVTPLGLQSGNWVWEVGVSPDQALAGPGGTPIAVELGFRLTGTPLVSVTNLSPLIFDTNTPGLSIFGWEIPYGSPARPEGIEANCASCSVINTALLGGHASTVVPGTTNEIFAAMGSIDNSLTGPIPLLKIIGKGPGNGGPSSSTIEWLGAYGGKGRIAQLVRGNNSENFDTFAGSATQVPEPASAMLLLCATLGSLVHKRRRRNG